MGELATSGVSASVVLAEVGSDVLAAELLAAQVSNLAVAWPLALVHFLLRTSAGRIGKLTNGKLTDMMVSFGFSKSLKSLKFLRNDECKSVG